MPKLTVSRRPFLLISIVLVAAGVAALLGSVDLDDFHRQVERRLSAALARPVQLGEAHFSLRHGPAFSFTDLRLQPAAEHDWSLHAERLYIQISPTALLRGRILFTRVLLQGAKLHLTIPPPGVPFPPAAAASGELRGHFPDIRALTVRRGTLVVEDRRNSANAPLVVENLEANLADMAAGSRGWLAVSGRLRQPTGKGNLRLAGEIAPAEDWRHTSFRLGLQVDEVAPALLLPLIAPEAAMPGTLSLQGTVEGKPAEGLHFAAELRGEELAVAFPGWRQSPLAMQSARLQGDWIAADAGGSLKNVQLALNDLSGSGDLSWRRQEGELWMEATLSTPGLPLPSLLQWLPETPAAGRLRQQFRDGFLEIRAARFAGPAAALRDPDSTLPLAAELAVSGLTLQAETHQLRQTAFTAALREGRLDVTEGRGLLLEQPVRFSGSLKEPFSSLPSFSMEAKGALPIGELLSRLPESARLDLEGAGNAEVQVDLAGTREAMNLDLQADLTSVQVRHGRNQVKRAGEKGDFLLRGEITRDRLLMRQARLLLAATEVQAQGALERKKGNPFRLDLELSAADLQNARPRLALLEAVQARGGATLRLQLSGENGRIRQRSGTIRLKEAGMRLAGAVADLDRIEGTLRLTGDRLEFDRVTALLGSSPVVLGGSVDQFADPEVTLRISAETIRADELICRSPEMLLREVEGSLHINRRGIIFERIRVRLDGGTRALIAGDLENFRNPVVTLGIDAEQGNIDEVIALWQGPPRAGKGKGNVRVQIAARVREGRLGPLHFQQAAGEIVHADGRLSIFPLRFTAGGGRCTGRVIVETGENPPLLQISGHVEEMDAAAAQLELLQRRGLITGRLGGDFYLEGRIGKTFLDTSLGGFNLAVDQGVLRKFKSLGRIFSLLNVSQIVALQLPDMAREGMPFNRLAATLQLKGGVLSTEDLFVDSEAMNLSVVGQMDLRTEELDLILGVKPLRTVDKIVTRIPVAGWILAGEEKALITAHFLVRGAANEAEVVPVPITSISEKVVGIFRRVLGLPGRVMEGVGEFVRPENESDRK